MFCTVRAGAPLQDGVLRLVVGLGLGLLLRVLGVGLSSAGRGALGGVLARWSCPRTWRCFSVLLSVDLWRLLGLLGLLALGLLARSSTRSSCRRSSWSRPLGLGLRLAAGVGRLLGAPVDSCTGPVGRPLPWSDFGRPSRWRRRTRSRRSPGWPCGCPCRRSPTTPCPRCSGSFWYFSYISSTSHSLAPNPDMELSSVDSGTADLRLFQRALCEYASRLDPAPREPQARTPASQIRLTRVSRLAMSRAAGRVRTFALRQAERGASRRAGPQHR